MKHPDYIVIGTGRCGTSFVAKTLHEKGICMGHSFKSSSPRHTQTGGTWEDRTMRRATNNCTSGKWGPAKWLETFQKLHSECDLAGAKDPDLALMPASWWKAVNPAKIIICSRPMDAVLESLRAYSTDFARAAGHAWRLLYALEAFHRGRPNVIKIDTGYRRTAEDVWEEIR